MSRRVALMTLIAVACLACLAGCGGPAADEAPHFGEDLEPIIEPVPSEPIAVDEGRPGVYLALPGVEPPARGFLVEAAAPRAGIVLLPGTAGLVESCRDLARLVADRGYVVVVPDLYEGVVPTSPLATAELLAGIGLERSQDLIAAASTLTRETAGDQALPVVGIGIGSSGHFAYEATRRGPGLSAVILDTTPLAREVDALRGANAPVYFVVGAENRGMPDYLLEEFAAVAQDAGVDLEVIRIEMAATTLLDAQAMGHNPGAQPEVLDHLDRIVASIREQ